MKLMVNVKLRQDYVGMKVTGCRSDNIKVIHLSVYKEWAETYLTILMKYCENSGNCSDMKQLVQCKERLPSLYTGAVYEYPWLPCRYLIDSLICPIFTATHFSVLFFNHLSVAGKIT
jgi:hypothetical protein